MTFTSEFDSSLAALMTRVPLGKSPTNTEKSPPSQPNTLSSKTLFPVESNALITVSLALGKDKFRWSLAGTGNARSSLVFSLALSPKLTLWMHRVPLNSLPGSGVNST